MEASQQKFKIVVLCATQQTFERILMW